MVLGVRSFYGSNEAFRNYVDRYSIKHGVSVETAFTHSTVRNAYEYYLDAEKRNASKVVLNVGCGGAELGGDCK